MIQISLTQIFILMKMFTMLWLIPFPTFYNIGASLQSVSNLSPRFQFYGKLVSRYNDIFKFVSKMTKISQSVSNKYKYLHVNIGIN